MNESDLLQILQSDSAVLFLWGLLILILILAKVYYRKTKNKSINVNRFLKKKICPFCQSRYSKKQKHCPNCQKELDKNQVIVTCFNCVYIGENYHYSKNPEFQITLILFSLFILLPGLIYFMFYSKKRVCKNCGRMNRITDY